MDREKVNEYFLNLINDIIKNKSEWRYALLCEAGYQYEGNDSLIEVEDEVTCEFNVDIKFGASKLVIISNSSNEISEKYVAKIPFGYITMNYCEEELKTYNSVLNNYKDYSQYFAECWYAGNVSVEDADNIECHVPVYIMKRADADEDKVEKSSYDFWLSDGGKPECYCVEEPEEEIVNCFKNCYGKQVGDMIEEVINELDITDLHSANIGFVEGYPVLIDYSGFWG